MKMSDFWTRSPSAEAAGAAEARAFGFLGRHRQLDLHVAAFGVLLVKQLRALRAGANAVAVDQAVARCDVQVPSTVHRPLDVRSVRCGDEVAKIRRDRGRRRVARP